MQNIATRSRRDKRHLGEMKEISPRTLRDLQCLWDQDELDERYFGQINEISSNLRACNVYMEGWGPQVGEVTLLSI